MHTRRTLVLPLLAAGLALAAAPLAESVLKDKDHQKLGESLTEYIEARETGKGLAKAMEDLDDQLAKWEKKAKGKDALSLTEDLGRAMWYAQAYADQKGIKKGRVTAYTATQPWELEYAVLAPKKYNAKNAYPLLLCIPDEGESPMDHLANGWAAAELRAGAILVGVPMPSDGDMWADRGSPDNPGGGGNVRIVYGRVKDQYAIDFDRVYLVGTGKGAAAALRIASESPDLFAGVIARSGALDAELSHVNFRNLPTLFLGEAEGVAEFKSSIDEAEYANVEVQLDDTDEAVWAWAQANARNSNPDVIVFSSNKPYVNKAYWLEVPPSDSDVHVEASVDRETNSISIDAQGVESVTLYFNDLIVDMNQPIKVVCNGSENLDQVPRNVATVLDLMWRVRSDPGKVYTARKTYDIPSQTN